MKTSILILMMATMGLFSYGQAGKLKSGTVGIETINSARTYEYADSMGKRLIIQNGGPKGEIYTDPNGKKYFKTIFWTRIINETNSPLELNIDFPVDSYELSSSPGNYYKVLIPSDTMTIDKEPLPDFGLTGLNFFLDDSIHKPPTLKELLTQKSRVVFMS